MAEEFDGRRTPVPSYDDLVPVEFRSVLRLRPLSKKERDDHEVLEIQSRQQQRHGSSSRTTTKRLASSAVLRALPRSETHSASSAAGPFMSPETARSTAAPDVEFHFDRAFGEHATQEDDIFAEIGRPISLAAMEPLFSREAMRTTHLNIAVGTCGSGKTYTCWGMSGNRNLKLKVPTDGMIPRMADSLFGQYQRLSSMHKNKPKCFFAVKVSALQVNQPKNPKSMSGDAGKLFDLLHPTSGGLRRHSYAQNSCSVVTSSTGSEKSAPTSDLRRTSIGSIDEAVYIDQDPLTHDFRVMNSHSRTCRSSEETRETLQEILYGSRRANNRRQQCHVMVQMQPVLVHGKTGAVVRTGGVVAFLDMAGCEDLAASQTKRSRFRATRLKDSLPSRADAHASVVHCLRSILFNELLRQGGNPADTMRELAVETGKSLARTQSTKQVPYLQHKVTMLLQPFFSANQSERTVVTMLVTASAGHRDYMEKRDLMGEVQSLWAPFHRASVAEACTGLDHHRRESRDDGKKKRQRIAAHSDSESDVVERHDARKPKLPSSDSSEESGSDDDYSLPPPIAPPRPDLRLAQDISRRASAPMEEVYEEHGGKVIIPMDRTKISDFPGVDIGKQQSPRHRSRPRSPSATIPESSRQKHGKRRSPLQPTSASNIPSKNLTGNTKQGRHNARRVHDKDPVEPAPKQKWSRTVEITTTTVESSDEALDKNEQDTDQYESNETGHPDVSDLRGENSVLKNEMEDLKRQNEELQRELKKSEMADLKLQNEKLQHEVMKKNEMEELRRQNELLQEQLKQFQGAKKSRKAVSWKDERDDSSNSSIEDVTPPSPAHRAVRGASAAQANARAQDEEGSYRVAKKPAPSSKLRQSPLLRDQMARLNAPKSSVQPVLPSSKGFNRYASTVVSVSSTSSSSSGFQLRYPAT